MNTPRLTRRSFLNLAGTMSAASLLAACALPTAAPGTSEEAMAEPIVIGWARHGNEVSQATEDTLAGLFQEANPGVEIDALALPWSDYNTKIPIDIAGGTAPDTFTAHPALMINSHAAGGAANLTERINAAEPGINYADILYPGDAEFDGDIFGLPQKSCTHQIRYNKDLFAEAGLPTPGELYWSGGADAWNFNSFVEIGQQLTKDLDGDGNPDQYAYAGIGGTGNVAMLRAAGGDIFDEAVTQCLVNSPESVSGLEYMLSLVENEIIPSPELMVNELGINFDTGRMAMAGGTTCDSVQALHPDKRLPFAWDFVVLPAGPGGFRCWGDTDQSVVSTSSANPDEAFDWIVFRASLDAWEQAYDGGMKLAFTDGPTRWSTFDSRAFTEPLGELDIPMIKEGYRHTNPDPFVPRSKDPYRVLFSIYATEINNMLRGTKTPQEAADDACALIDSEILA